MTEDNLIALAKAVIEENLENGSGDLLEFIDSESDTYLEDVILQLCRIAEKYEHLLSITRSSSSS